jgi:F-type H+-transporting ATPase subunit epsilon
MYEKPFGLEIITPDRIVFKGEATSVSAPGVVGGFQVLFHHAALLSSLAPGKVTVKDVAGNDHAFAASGGTLEVHGDTVVLLADSAEPVAEIDTTRARAALDRAQERLKHARADIDVERAQRALYRALNRLRVAGKV